MRDDAYDSIGFPAEPTRVYRSRESRYRRTATWRNRMSRPLWFRALLARGCLR